jgi:hypothetical protein
MNGGVHQRVGASREDGSNKDNEEKDKMGIVKVEIAQRMKAYELVS